MKLDRLRSPRTPDRPHPSASRVGDRSGAQDRTHRGGVRRGREGSRRRARDGRISQAGLGGRSGMGRALGRMVCVRAGTGSHEREGRHGHEFGRARRARRSRPVRARAVRCPRSRGHRGERRDQASPARAASIRARRRRCGDLPLLASAANRSLVRAPIRDGAVARRRITPACNPRCDRTRAFPDPDAARHALRRPYVFSFQSPVHKEVLDEREFPLATPLHNATAGLVKAVERRVVSKAARNVVLSRFMQGQLSELSPRAASEALVLPGAVDLEHFTPGAGIQHPWVAHAAPLLFTARRLVPRTGVGELVRAMPSIVQRHPAARLAIAGAGPLEPDIREDIQRLGLEECVSLLGRIPEDDLVRWYRWRRSWSCPRRSSRASA